MTVFGHSSQHRLAIGTGDIIVDKFWTGSRGLPVPLQADGIAIRNDQFQAATETNGNFPKVLVSRPVNQILDYTLGSCFCDYETNCVYE